MLRFVLSTLHPSKHDIRTTLDIRSLSHPEAARPTKSYFPYRQEHEASVHVMQAPEALKLPTSIHPVLSIRLP